MRCEEITAIDALAETTPRSRAVHMSARTPLALVRAAYREPGQDRSALRCATETHSESGLTRRSKYSREKASGEHGGGVMPQCTPQME